ncbi:hypothetical protein CASFOL_024995 [Castilleja foliolosa]|uniref:J domain-containing protein n=1 Tax=Castilleja foliolosa TaxID=1961234 RepID=A0ABD3CRR4_9LAMI
MVSCSSRLKFILMVPRSGFSHLIQMWRNAWMPKNSIIQSATTTHLASFHSTGAFLEKWKIKFNSDVRGNQQQSKNYIRYEVRQKRSESKKALKSILFKGGCSTLKGESFPNIEADYASQLNKKSRIKPARRANKRDQHKKSKRKHQKEDSYEDYFDESSDRFFHATFGKNGFSWNFKPSGTQFDWTNGRFNPQDGASMNGFGTYADRKILGLPMSGHLKIEDVKAAFRSSALKWHPDKHQGSSKANAEEKFKHCVDAYKSLCNTLSTI